MRGRGHGRRAGGGRSGVRGRPVQCCGISPGGGSAGSPGGCVAIGIWSVTVDRSRGSRIGSGSVLGGLARDRSLGAMTVDLMVSTTSTSTACCAAARTAPGGATTPTTTELAPLSASRILGVGGRRGLFVLLAGYGAPLLCVACTRGAVVGIRREDGEEMDKKDTYPR